MEKKHEHQPYKSIAFYIVKVGANDARSNEKQKQTFPFKNTEFEYWMSVRFLDMNAVVPLHLRGSLWKTLFIKRELQYKVLQFD